MQAEKKLKIVVWVSIVPWVVLLLTFLLVHSARDQDNFASLGYAVVGGASFLVTLASALPGLVVSIAEVRKERSKWSIAATVLCSINMVVLVAGLSMVLQS